MYASSAFPSELLYEDQEIMSSLPHAQFNVQDEADGRHRSSFTIDRSLLAIHGLV